MNKEQMIEKIREVVVIANNPKCKTYEEALKMEKETERQSLSNCMMEYNHGYISQCSISQYYSAILGFHWAKETIIGELKQRCFEFDDDGLLYDEDNNPIEKMICNVEIRNALDDIEEVIENINIRARLGRESKILGLPLTLERVMVALTKKIDCCYRDGNICELFNNFNSSFDLVSICKWQPNKTLDDQSQETIKAIYEILCV
jgi:hypothetical protein